MSCDWDVYCRTCDSYMGLSDWNQALDAVRELIAHAPDWVKIWALNQELYHLGLHMERGGRAVCLEFFHEHASHDLVARNEYGRTDGTCGKTWKCHACNEPHRCNRPEGHTGECGLLEPGEPQLD